MKWIVDEGISLFQIGVRSLYEEALLILKSGHINDIDVDMLVPQGIHGYECSAAYLAYKMLDFVQENRM